MGYQVTITRTDENSDDGLISKEEWLDYCRSDSELTIEDENENFPSVTWASGRTSAELFWEEMGVWAWTPEVATFLKMIDIAGKLNARVIGEDGTVFEKRPDGSILEISPGENSAPDENPGPDRSGMDIVSEDTKPWWKKLFG